MSALHAYQFRLHNGAHQLGVSTVNNQKNALFQEFILNIAGCLLQRKESLFTGHVGKVYYFLNDLRDVHGGRLKDQANTLKSGKEIRYCITRENTHEGTAKGNQDRRHIYESKYCGEILAPHHTEYHQTKTCYQTNYRSYIHMYTPTFTLVCKNILSIRFY